MRDDDSEKREASRRTRAAVDRIEDGGWAVLQIGDDAKNLLNLPVSLLPEGATDGDRIIINVKIDRDARDDAATRIRALQEKLERRARDK